MRDLNLENVQKPEGLLFVGSPRQYRADCKSGQFKIGASKNVGTRMKMEVIAARFIEGEFFGYDWKKWVNIIFADESGAVSSMMLKTESLDNFLEVYRSAIESNQTLLRLQLEAAMSARANDNGKFFAVEFSVAGDGKFSEHIAAFRAELPGDIYRLAIGNGNGSSEHAEDEAEEDDAPTKKSKKQR